jgi:hypothetical protein
MKQATPCSKVGNSMTNETVELVRPLHGLVAPAARQHLAAMLGDDGGHKVGVFLVFHGVDDAGPCDPIGWHAFLLGDIRGFTRAASQSA